MVAEFFNQLIAHPEVITLFQNCCNHPLPEGLREGSLSQEKFIEFLWQDARYLPVYTQALTKAHALLLQVNTEEAELFDQYVKDCSIADKGVKEMLQAALQAEASRPHFFQPKQHTINSACQRYIEHLQAAMKEEVLEIIVACTLPCFWLYRELGKRVGDVAHLASSHPFRAWLLSYADENFYTAVDKMIAVFERYAQTASKSMQNRMIEAFIQSMRCEYDFFHVAYHGERVAAPALGM